MKKSKAAVLVIILLLISAVFYVLYKNNFQIASLFKGPTIKEVSAQEFKTIKASELSQLSEKGLAAWEEQNLYIMDIRSRQDYASGHVKGSSSVPFEKAKERAQQGAFNNSNYDIAIYSSNSLLGEAQEVSRLIKEQLTGEDSKNTGKNTTIFIIRDGYEGLVKSGVVTEVKRWD